MEGWTWTMAAASMLAVLGLGFGSDPRQGIVVGVAIGVGVLFRCSLLLERIHRAHRPPAH
jgi:hypothetical protein